MMVNRRTSGLPLICLICGDVARGMNFDVMTCMSCKIFFRRHALKPKRLCVLDGNCEIAIRTRSACSACRLNKCFSFGMNPELIRNWGNIAKHVPILKIMDHYQNGLPMPEPIGLLQNDRSNLTTYEWNLLSNILHAYDEVNIIPQINYLLQQQASLPPKIRSKVSTSTDVLKVFLGAFQPFVERSPYFQGLSVYERRALIQHNSGTAGTFNCLYIIREVNASDNMAFAASCSTVYGNDIFKYFNYFVTRLEPNDILIKIMLLILAYSTNCSIVNSDHTDNMINKSNGISLLYIQDIFVTMFWKYLNYQYGFVGAVRHFNSLIQYILDLLRSINEKQTIEHEKMIDTIVEETTRSLVIKN